MRLRLDHALLEAATVIEAQGLGFELWPLHYDCPGAPRTAYDRATGVQDDLGAMHIERVA
ncbi:hypothetical protein [Streptomyces acidiscabies]|uniref:Uncharacterized protein n=1 Tax=Streptomyces acidiscabies TaxID=42234 RepID=A0ABU4LW99_9ACTN|nr:hypothetical protein [Streptomyces acidiscabies]MDX3020036.1 hypothetical protein [Streptomyces acidiscabies]